jgi:RsiW-degrading membrane proteinase PrsW (M82 family)
MISMGFATMENIFYVLEGGWGVGFMRIFMAVPAHATFDVLMGYFVGLSKFRQQRILYEIIGVASAILLHGAYDFFLMIKSESFVALGAILSLVVGIRLSMKAMSESEKLSPFSRKSTDASL